MKEYRITEASIEVAKRVIGPYCYCAPDMYQALNKMLDALCVPVDEWEETPDGFANGQFRKGDYLLRNLYGCWQVIHSPDNGSGRIIATNTSIVLNGANPAKNWANAEIEQYEAGEKGDESLASQARADAEDFLVNKIQESMANVELCVSLLASRLKGK